MPTPNPTAQDRPKPANPPAAPPATPDLYGWGAGVTRNQQGTPIPEWRRHVALRAATSLYSGRGDTAHTTIVAAARTFAAYLAGDSE